MSKLLLYPSTSWLVSTWVSCSVNPFVPSPASYSGSDLAWLNRWIIERKGWHGIRISKGDVWKFSSFWFNCTCMYVLCLDVCFHKHSSLMCIINGIRSTHWQRGYKSELCLDTRYCSQGKLLRVNQLPKSQTRVQAHHRPCYWTQPLCFFGCEDLPRIINLNNPCFIKS